MNRQALVSLGRMLWHRRQDLDMSLRDVAVATGVSASTLSRLERGAGDFDLVTLSTVAQWLHVRLDSLFEVDSAQPMQLTTVEQIAALLLADPALSQEHAMAIAQTVRVTYAALARKTGESDR